MTQRQGDRRSGVGTAEAPTVFPPQSAGEREYRLAFIVGLFILLGGLFGLMHGRVPETSLGGFLPMFGAAMTLLNLLVAYLLYGKARLEENPALCVIAGGYLFTGIFTLAQFILLPGALTEKGLGYITPQFGIWLWLVWHSAFPLYALSFAYIRHRRLTIDQSWSRYILYLTLAAALGALLAIIHFDSALRLPILVMNGRYDGLIGTGAGFAPLALNVGALIALLIVMNRTNRLHLWFAVTLLAYSLDVLLTLTSGARFSLGWYVGRCYAMLGAGLMLGVFSHDMTRTSQKIHTLNRQLQDLANSDTLTGLANRRSFNDMLGRIWQDAQRHGFDVALLMIDIDHFKLYNDALGHTAGDDCLRRIAQAIGSSARRSFDLAVRLGGEEFALLLPRVDSDGAMTVANRVLKTVEDLRIPHPRGDAAVVTVSIGAVSLKPSAGDYDETELMQCADQALYRAKAQGRNCMVLADEEDLEEIA